MDRNIFLIVLIVLLVLFYINNMYEHYVSGSYDITAPITVNMDWKGATLSKYPYYTNNLVNPPADVLNKIQELQTYNVKEDGNTNSNYVKTCMTTQANLDNPMNREGFEGIERIEGFEGIEKFSMMNPYIPN